MSENVTLIAAIICLVAIVFYFYAKQVATKRRIKAGYEEGDDEPNAMMVYVVVGLVIVIATIITYVIYFK